MSLLLSEGHHDARQYPLMMMWSEVRIVRQRMAQRRKQETVLMQLAISSVLSKDSGKDLQALLGRMDESD